ncbi:bll6948 [Bradyrhizobium diazoefficiens USDA 110]|uniref:Bll6948 protein n=2 Tax=Bradyrhizobium diazoefficiens TaxID=1355477 RepID=Q89EX1_BRADU|nr:TonB-dependent receptor [Bradyrhizobium diazoefficiens]AND91943.1 TonB-dependent receptor [Bradyrhizobium diazoefficiens USDA 110]PDT61852.1 TonB-dependent receptor [Bradyrhizobium diazoefficiens]QBP25688.1 TonB-dependent receptor [Bradyrhizobium diazoefficiens]QLD41449.1 TonB-dependent receptor [Bradyrhizobium diazoefficiens]WLA75875.1 TonB-dependent receptor [Bradyrhizobium diazoefficiens]
MRPRRSESCRRCGPPTVLSALWLLVVDGNAFAQSDGGLRELPPVQIFAGQTPRHKRPPASRHAGTSTRAGHRIFVYPAAAPASGTRSVASGPEGPPGMASALTVSGEELNARPFTRPGEVLEAVPGLIVTQHSGEGKANQYFVRGYNLDHGTDLAIYVDDVPVNMRTHAHGQGYADLNWLIPETISAMDVRKGPYFADESDFASVGSVRIGLIDRTEKGLAQVTAGSFGYRRLLGMDSAKLGEGAVLVAGEIGTYNGPWDNPDNARKLNGLVRFSQGTATDGLTVTGMAYANKWNSTDQVPQRAITSSFLDRFGSEDSTDGGNTNRFALSGRVAQSDELGSWKANAYVVKSQLDLFNNFTYYLSDPVLGDQFHQHDDRLMAGANISRTLNGSFAGLPMQTTVGLQSRYDAIDLALTNTVHRSYLSSVRSDKVGEGSVGVYAENTLRWTDWLRTTVGWRGDYYAANVISLFNSNNSGHADASLGSPKFRMVLGPFNQTEFFLGAGYGMHSNDARGATTTEDPSDPATKLSPSPLLVRTRGAEVGVRSRIIPGLDTSFSVFILDQDSEILFSGDAGNTEATRASRRYGFEWTNHCRPRSWIDIDADLAMTRARFRGYDSDQAEVYAALAGYPEAQIGNAPGNYIPNAPPMVASAGITLGEKTGWFGSLRWRYLAASPLTEDNAFRSSATGIFNGRLGYRADNGWRIQLDVLNLFDARANQITYAYGSLLKTDALYNLCTGGVAPAAVCRNGVMDYVLHPVEPLSFRLTVAGTF